MTRITSRRIRQAFLVVGEPLDPDYEPESLALYDQFGNPMDFGGSAIPGGGTEGQVLGKLSDDDFDTGWIDGGGGGLGPLESWNLVGTSGQPGFGSPWSNYPANAPVGFRKYPTGQVCLKGLLQAAAYPGAAASTIFQLPADYRPATGSAAYRYTVATSGGPGFIQILEDGSVQSVPMSNYASINAGSWVDLVSIQFDTETV